MITGIRIREETENICPYLKGQTHKTNVNAVNNRSNYVHIDPLLAAHQVIARCRIKDRVQDS